MRQQALQNLLEFNLDTQTLSNELKAFTWETTEPPAILTRVHIRNILLRYLDGMLNEKQIEDWANIIEGREDIDFESGYENLLQKIIFQLANPVLTTTLTPQTAQHLCTSL